MPKYTYTDIQPLAFTVEAGIPALVQKLWRLDVPNAWYEKLLALHQISNGGDEYASLPTRSLSQVLHLLAPDVIFFDPSSWRSGGTPWLLSWEPITPEAVRLITAGWAIAEYGRNGANADSVQQVVSQLQEIDVQWRKEEINFAQWNQEPNGTAQAATDYYFRALPHLVCALLSEANIDFPGPWGSLRFLRVRTPQQSSSAELVSWPALRTGRWAYSYVVKFSVETVPFQAHPLVQCHVSIRRWVSESLQRNEKYNALSFEADSSVYIRSEDPWLTGLPRPRGFATTRLELVRGNGRPEPQWGGLVAEIVSRLGLDSRLPPPQELCQQPRAYLEGQFGSAVAIVHSNRLGIRHRVTPGVPLPDRKTFLDRVGYLLREYGFAPVDRLNRVSPKAPRPVSSLTKPFDSVPKEQLRAHLGRLTGGHLRVEILHQPGPLMEIIQKELHKTLGLDGSGFSAGSYTHQTPEVTVTVTKQGNRILFSI